MARRWSSQASRTSARTISIPRSAAIRAAACAARRREAGAKILLAHQPRSAPAAATAGFDLQLSGHTHGGQFWPWNLFVRLSAALHRRAAPAEYALGLCQPGNRLLGTAEPVWRAVGNHAASGWWRRLIGR